MKNLFISALAGVGLLLASSAQGQVILKIVDPNTGLSSETVTSQVGSSFTLDIDVQDTTGTAALAGFDLALAPLPAGITLTGYTQVLPNFTPNIPGSPNSAIDGNSSQDVIIGSIPTNILKANFTITGAVVPGTYTIDFVAPGFNQDLVDDIGNTIPYTDQGMSLTVTSVPEPGIGFLLFFGLIVIFMSNTTFKSLFEGLQKR